MSEETKKKSGRGGARPGAGRPRGTSAYQKRCVVAKEEEWNAIREAAEKAGKTVSRFIIDAALSIKPQG